MKIDFVVAWVNGSDPKWLNERNKYCETSTEIQLSQYRDWDVFQYWFRAVEKYAPWVNKIHLITWGHLPNWLNTQHEKLNIVKHSDYIPAEYLPTFSSHVIELNFHRIPELAEHFVYFNDDMYLFNFTSERDFFINGYPCDTPIMAALAPSVVGDPFIHYLCNDLSLINTHFQKKDVLRKNFKKWYSLKYKKLILKNIYYSAIGKFTGFNNFHLPSALTKSTYEEVWEAEYDLLNTTCLNKFRNLHDVNQYIISYYSICEGKFIPRSPNIGKFFTIGENNDELYKCMKNGKYKMLCINDNTNNIQADKENEKLIEVFESIFPKRSSYEIGGF